MQQQAQISATLDQYHKSLSLTNEWVRFLDTKATAVLAANAAIAAALASVAKDGGWYLLPPLIGILFSIYHGILCIAPRLYPTRGALPNLLDVVGPPHFTATALEKTSVIFFEHVAEHANGAAFLAASREIYSDPERLLEHVAEQVWANARVARNKSYHVGRAVQFFVWALLLGIGSAVVYYLLKKG